MTAVSSTESQNLPVLFVIFNRPETALRSFTRIKEFKPKQLFIAQDGAREQIAGEKALTEKTLNGILSAIDWPCDVKTLVQEKNLGCGKGVYSAIDWFFDNVEFGVILEDDCVAEKTFFDYAYDALTRYMDDTRIGMVAGFNPISMVGYPYSVIFSKFKSCWGWGSWRRAWKNMDLAMTWRDSCQSDDIIRNCGYARGSDKEWYFKMKCIDRNYVSAWDWQWYFSLAAQNQLCLYPHVNLISNIGNDAQATHTSFSDITIPSEPIGFPLKYPPFVAPDEKFDLRFYKESNSFKIRLSRMLPHKLKNFLKRTLSSFKK